MRLTVAIPTFNRNQLLCESLELLLPQLTGDCELLVVDNNSDVPVEDTLRDMLVAFPGVRCRIVRNRFNIGGAANILRCFELCETEWLWLFGDDDHAVADAVSVIFQHIDDNSHCCFFNFVAPHFERSGPLRTVGRDDFIEQLDDWGNLNFMSVGVFHCPTIMPQLRLGYQYAYSMSPHLALLLSSLQEDSSCLLSDARIIEHQSPGGWAPAIAQLGKMSLLDLPMLDATRRTFARKLRSKPSLEATAVMFLQSAQIQGSSREALYQYDQICARAYCVDCSWITRVKIVGYRLIVRFHRLMFPIFARGFPALTKLIGKGHLKFGEMATPDMYQRL